MTSKSKNVEYFFDHVRIEQMLFDGALVAQNGRLHPDLNSPGMGITLKRADAQPFSVFHAQCDGGV